MFKKLIQIDQVLDGVLVDSLHWRHREEIKRLLAGSQTFQFKNNTWNMVVYHRVSDIFDMILHDFIINQSINNTTNQTEHLQTSDTLCRQTALPFGAQQFADLSRKIEQKYIFTDARAINILYKIINSRHFKSIINRDSVWWIPAEHVYMLWLAFDYARGSVGLLSIAGDCSAVDYMRALSMQTFDAYTNNAPVETHKYWDDMKLLEIAEKFAMRAAACGNMAVVEHYVSKCVAPTMITGMQFLDKHPLLDLHTAAAINKQVRVCKYIIQIANSFNGGVYAVSKAFNQACMETNVFNNLDREYADGLNLKGCVFGSTIAITIRRFKAYNLYWKILELGGDFARVESTVQLMNKIRAHISRRVDRRMRARNMGDIVGQYVI